MNDLSEIASPPRRFTLIRVLHADGIIVNGLRYQSTSLQALRLEPVDHSVKVRIDLLDIGEVFVRSGSDWIRAQLLFDEAAAANLFRKKSSKSLIRRTEEIYAERARGEHA